MIKISVTTRFMRGWPDTDRSPWTMFLHARLVVERDRWDLCLRVAA